MNPEQPQPNRPVDRLKSYEQRYAFSCGPASLVIAYLALGRNYSEERIMRDVDLTLNGTDWPEMIIHVTDYAGYGCNFRAKSSWEEMRWTLEQNGNPIIVSWESDRRRVEIRHVLEAEPEGHYSVVKKMTDTEITLLDPGYGDEFTIPKTYFEERWYEQRTEKAFLEIRP